MQVRFNLSFRHTYPVTPNARAAVETTPKCVCGPLVVYIRPSTVSITVTSEVLDVLAVVVLDELVVLDAVVGVGVGVAAAPFVGTSPARTVIDISPVRAMANRKRFMVLNLLWI
jgi:hypothetical protein